MKKFLASLATAAIVSAGATALAASYSDIPQMHWAYNSVVQMTDAGIVEGYSDGTFCGDKNITRAEMAKWSANLMLKLSPASKADAEKLIEDCSQPNGDKPATRYEVALMLYEVCDKALNGKLPAASNAFADVPADHWAAKSVNLMAALKIMEGYGDGTFRGDKNMTRYEAALTLKATMQALDK